MGCTFCHTNGVYYGQNVISKNMIIADRRQLLNGNEFILGVSGGGKSFTAKGEVINQVLAGNADIIIIDPEREYSPLVRALGGEIINISATSPTHINAMDMNREYGDGANPVILKSEFIMSLCEQLIGGNNLGAVQKSIIDRCTASVYRTYQQNNYTGEVPTLQDFRAELLKQSEPEAQEIALAIELFTNGSLNTFAKKTNVNTDNRLICYDILDLGKQLMPIGMLVVLDSILNRITQNRAKGKNTFIFIDEIYLLFQHEYSANFLFTLWKRVRKYGAYATGITQNVDDLLQSHTARTMLANSEFIVMLNQASTDRLELAKLLNISDTQLSYITNVDAGHGLIKVGSNLVPFANKFPKNTKLYIENLITFARGLKQVGGMNMDFSAFDTAKMDEYATKAKEKWQHTNAYQEYTQKNKGRSKDAEEALARGVMLIFSDFGKCKDGDPALPEAQALVKRLQAYISENYYQCTPEILKTLGAMYGAGGEFTENIDKAGGEGTAKFVERAISIYCK